MTVHRSNLPDEAIVLTPERQLLLDAAQYIREHGWCQGDMRIASGAVCAHGALDSICQCLAVYLQAHNLLCETIKRRSIAAWNDAPERTAAEVISAMENAAWGKSA